MIRSVVRQLTVDRRRSPGLGLVLLVLAAGCSGREGSGGSNQSAGQDRPARPFDRAEIDAARSVMMDQPDAVDPNDISPVSVLFVNGAPLTVEDVLKWVRPDLERMVAEMPPDEYQVNMVRFLRGHVRREAERLLLLQQAERELNEQQEERLMLVVDQRLRDIVTREYAGRQSRYEDELVRQGISPADNRERLRREMLVGSYLQRMVRGKVAEPTRRELLRVYEQFVADARGQRRCQMWLIDIPYGDHDALGQRLRPPVSRDQAWQAARRAAGELQSAGSFAEVAKRHSQGINTASGGDWGLVGREGVRPRWQPAVERLFTLAEGQTSDIIDTGETFFIVNCSAIDEPEVGTFTEMQTRLVEAYQAKQFELLSQELVGKLFAEADVRPANPGRFLRAVVEASPQPTFARGG